jgi:hypothetical protein
MSVMEWNTGDQPAEPGFLAGALWVGTLSYEERCLGSLYSLHRLGIVPEFGVVLRYSTTNDEENVCGDRIDVNAAIIERMAPMAFGRFLGTVSVSMYSTLSLENAILSLVSESKATCVLFDMTCMTKLHAIALAGFLASGKLANWKIAYTQPDNYGSLDDREVNKWADVLIAPVTIGSSFGSEEASRGVIIAGFEVHRIMVALGEVEPPAGLILVGKTPGRPDQLKLSMRRHVHLIDRLTKRSRDRWKVVSPDIFDFAEVFTLIDQEVAIAAKDDAPILLFPFGPKPLVFGSCFRLVEKSDNAAWFLYTVPANHDLEYSEGVAKTTWFGPPLIDLR